MDISIREDLRSHEDDVADEFLDLDWEDGFRTREDALRDLQGMAIKDAPYARRGSHQIPEYIEGVRTGNDPKEDFWRKLLKGYM